jgi:hypothetical protein
MGGGGGRGAKRAGRLNNPFGGDLMVCFLALGGEVTPVWNVRRFARKNNHKVIKIIIIIMSGFLPPCPSSSVFQSKKKIILIFRKCMSTLYYRYLVS